MAMSEAFQGSLLTTASEQTVIGGSGSTAMGVYQVVVSALAAPATFAATVRVKGKVLSSDGAKEVIVSQLVAGGSQACVFPSLMLMHEWDVTVQRVSGTDTNVRYSIRKVG